MGEPLYLSAEIENIQKMPAVKNSRPSLGENENDKLTFSLTKVLTYLYPQIVKLNKFIITKLLQSDCSIYCFNNFFSSAHLQHFGSQSFHVGFG